MAEDDPGLEKKRQLLAQLLRSEASKRDATGPATPERLSAHRELFAALQNKVYLNFGGQGPLPQPAIAAIAGAYAEIQRRGPFSNSGLGWMQQQMGRLRIAIAQELGTQPETIALTENVSLGCNIVLWGIDWQPGDHLLLSDCEYPGVLAAIEGLRRRFGIEVSACPLAGGSEAEAAPLVAELLRPRTRLVVLSHIFWSTGGIAPLKAIAAACRAHPTEGPPVRLLVDAAQSVGMLPLDLPDLGVDYYAFTGHKWWCGPEGVGGLYVRPEAMGDLQPTFSSWRALPPDWPDTACWPDARRYEIATSAWPLIAALSSALALHNQWGTAHERYQRIRSLAIYLWEQLGHLQSSTALVRHQSDPPETGILTFSTGTAPAHLVQVLEAQGIFVRALPAPRAGVRVCVHYLTLKEEIDKFIAGLRQSLRR